MRALRRLWFRWKSRGYRRDEHLDCISFLGPCNECRDFLRGRGIEPDGVRPLGEMNRATRITASTPGAHGGLDGLS